MPFKIGQTPWIKGKSKYPRLNDRDWLYQKYVIEKESPHQIANEIGCNAWTVANALKRLGFHIRTLSEALRGESNPTFGKPRSKETKEKISAALKNPCEETRQKHREARKHRRFPKHHTKPELIFEGICKKNNLPFRYTGDGSFWIGKGRDTINPDFMHLTRKIAVEIFSWHHDQLNNWHVRPKGRYEVRKKIFKKYRYKMIVFWQDDLDREDAEQFVLTTLRKKGVI